MIRSMTGFTALTREDDRATIGVTLRSVNHRYLDVQLRIPQSFSSVEAGLRAAVQRHVSRGRVELSVSIQARQAASPEVELNEEFVRQLAEAFERARAKGLIEGGLQPGDLLRLPQALTIKESVADSQSTTVETLSPAIESAVGEALVDLNVMRGREGAHLAADLDRRRGLLERLIERLADAARDGRAGLEARLATRVAELTVDLQVDRAAIAMEIVRMAGRSDISEEVVRFRAHLAQWAVLVNGQEPCGRKLDFLLQEMNREVNTIGSKADGCAVSELIIEAKAELEKMREQVQNVE